MGIVEPFFCSVCLYQVDQKTKEAFQISEKFHFHNNTPAILEKLHEHWVSYF